MAIQKAVLQKWLNGGANPSYEEVSYTSEAELKAMVENRMTAATVQINIFVPSQLNHTIRRVESVEWS
jgi:hypothetical protein